ncbi:hypothetical protein [Rathayibacter rathayi]|uniref:hypothetical protein n=1 Tax=Rathayibacter rathayi TaxID=33887 RepID=UPI0015E3F9AB|nr:hypothetical protein [Rathayibacter rathayi]
MPSLGTPQNDRTLTTLPDELRAATGRLGRRLPKEDQHALKDGSLLHSAAAALRAVANQ